MMLLNFKLDSIYKLKMLIVFLLILLVIVVILMCLPYLLNLSVLNSLNVVTTILSIVLPFIIGYYYSIYVTQKSAINELSKKILKLWSDACHLEYISTDDNFFQNAEFINSDIFHNARCFKKEISILYILGVYFNNIKWYEHQMYYLPDNFKVQIDIICKTYVEIDYLMLEFTSTSFYDFVQKIYIPMQYNHKNTQNVLLNFFEFIISNSDKNFKKDFEIIYNEIKKHEITYSIVNGKREYS